MKNKEKQIKDKSRVSNFGEVLTSKREVLNMLNLVNTEKDRKEQERIRYNRETFEKERRYIYWVDPTKTINQNRLGSSQTWRKEKKYKYYD